MTTKFISDMGPKSALIAPRPLRTKSPKKYWKIINNTSDRNTKGCSPEVFFNYYSDTSALNEEDCTDAYNDITCVSVPEQALNTDINGPITKTEIEKAIKCLKNGKSIRIDDIVNGQIKASKGPGRVAQSVGHLTRKSGVLGSIPGLATYFRFSFRFFKKGSCQLLAKVCARSTG